VNHYGKAIRENHDTELEIGGEPPNSPLVAADRGALKAAPVNSFGDRQPAL
jgi:hypothetical protein